LRLAVKLGNAAAAKALVEAGAKPDAELLYGAIRKGDGRMTAAALATGFSPTREAGGYDDTPIHYAIDRGHRACVEVMLDHGVSPNWAPPDGEPLLHTAIRFERINGPRRLFVTNSPGRSARPARRVARSVDGHR
jgi:hypothetical protein